MSNMPTQRSRMANTYLETIVAMIPRSAVLERDEPVCEGAPSPGYWTLGHCYTVHVVCVQLSNAMPMNRGTHVLKVIRDVHDYLIAPAGFDDRARVSVVECHSRRHGESVGGQGCLINVQPILWRLARANHCRTSAHLSNSALRNFVHNFVWYHVSSS